MKARWLTLLIAALIIISASLGLSTERSTERSTDVFVVSQDLAPDALAEKSGCLQCHSVDKMVKGPPFHDIAERYKNDPQARAALIKTVRDGGKGHWTELTGGKGMPPHSARLSMAEIERLVDWVLTR